MDFLAEFSEGHFSVSFAVLTGTKDTKDIADDSEQLPFVTK